MYEVMADPLIAGAVNGIETAVALEVVTLPIIPAAGDAAAYGVTEFEVPEEVLVPAPLVAVIENVYACPCTKLPLYVSGFAVAGEVNVSTTDGDEVVVYPVIAEPLIAPAVYGIETVEPVVPATVPMVGAAGGVGVRVVTAAEVWEASEAPTPFVAITLNL